MWAYKYIQKETKLEVPKFKVFLFQNQDLLKLWYEDESEPMEDRISFAMRFLKYSVELFMQLVILFVLLNSKDEEFQKVCSKRLGCYNNCNNAYFPSLVCRDIKNFELDYKIDIHGNTFDTFYKYPDPEFVKANEEEYVAPVVTALDPSTTNDPANSQTQPIDSSVTTDPVVTDPTATDPTATDPAQPDPSATSSQTDPVDPATVQTQPATDPAVTDPVSGNGIQVLGG